MRIGSFQLEAVIGQGGSGVVWRARHPQHTEAVAVKVLTDAAARRAGALRDFQREVRAFAALQHPNVVSVFDYGRVGSSTEAIPAGSPFLVMELVESTKLHGRRLKWAQVRRLTLALLEALAHAHARGVIHRDIKPANVLCDPELEVVKLTDFGLARRPDAEQTLIDRRLSFLGGGTPGYMAPEQVDGRWRDFEPSTDLYGLGSMVHALLTGAPPAIGRALPEGLPGGFDAWLGRMLEVEQGRRFQRAADAARALRRVGEGGALEVSVDLEEGPTVVDGSADGLESAPSPPPESWRVGERSSRPALLGMGLIGLRAVPLAGRFAERDALWDQLRAVVETGRPHALVLRGEAGVGKSRLAQWLAHRAEESGTARVLRAVHDPEAGGGHGLGPLLERLVRCQGLEGAARTARVEAGLARLGLAQPELVEAVLQRVAPTDYPVSERSEEVPRALLEPGELRATLRHLFERLCARRPLMLLLDDVQWSRRSLLLAEAVACSRAAPILVVLTLREEALEMRPAEAEIVARICARRNTASLAVEPLPPPHRRALLQDTLGLAPESAAAIEARAQGNPLFAVALFEDWARRGLLRPGPRGLELDDALDPAGMPDSLRGMLVARVERLFGPDSPDRRALELAAVLGVDGDDPEWFAACQAAGVPTPGGDLDELVLRHGIGRRDRDDPSAWSFTHALWRDSLVAAAEQAGRLVGHHAACAEAVATLRRPRSAARMGAHLLAAGRPEAALDALLLAARREVLAGDPAAVGPVLERVDEALEALYEPEKDPRWGRALVLHARLERARGALELAAERAQLARSTAHRRGWHKVHIDALLELAESFHELGRSVEAGALLAEGLVLADALGDQRRAARCQHGQAIAWLSQGDLDAAEKAIGEARQDFEAVRAVLDVARCEMVLARVMLQSGRLQAVVEHTNAARRLFWEAGCRSGTALCDNLAGEAARLAGDHAGAERAYRAALETWARLGMGYVPFARANLGLIALERGDPLGATPLVEAALEDFRAGGREAVATQMLVALLPCRAARRDWARFDAALDEAEAYVRAADFADLDMARMANYAAALCEHAKDLGRARRAWIFAADQFVALGHHKSAQQVEAQLARI